MARLSVEGLEELMQDLESVAEIPDGVAFEMLNNQADVVCLAHQKQIMADDMVDTGQLFASVGRDAVKREGADRHIEVYPKGRRKNGVRNAEVGFILEYGTPGRDIPARNWMQRANDSCADRTTEAARQVYDEYLTTKNL